MSPLAMNRRPANLRTALVLAAIAIAFFVFIIVRHWS